MSADITTLGKIIGGGLPVGAYGGASDLMAKVAPEGAIYQAGTLSGNPLAMAAGIETLRQLMQPGLYEGLERISSRLETGLSGAAAKTGAAMTINRVGSMMTAFFTADPVTDFDTALKSDTRKHAAFFNRMLNAGVSLAPSQFEALFVSCAHTEADIDATVAAAHAALTG